MRVVVLAHFGHAHIARAGGGHRLLCRARAVQVDVGVRGRPGRRARRVAAGGARGHAALGRLDRQRGLGLGQGLRRLGDAGVLVRARDAELGQLRRRQLLRQVEPAELFIERIGTGLGHHAPVVDGARGAAGNAGQALLANRRIDDVVVGVVRDRLDGTRGLAGAAADADGRVDQVLLEQRGVGSGVHDSSKAHRFKYRTQYRTQRTQRIRRGRKRKIKKCL